MPLQTIPRDISIADSLHLDSFSKTRTSEVSHGCAIEFKYGVSQDPKVKLNVSSLGFAPSITFNSVNRAAVFNKTSATTGSASIGITSANPLSFKAGSTFKGYISFKILNIASITSAEIGSVGFGGNGANAIDTLENGGYMFVFNSTGYALRIVNTTFSTVFNTTVNRSSWTDQLNGTGKSGLTIDFTKPQIFFVRAESGKNSEITFGFVIGGKEIDVYSYSPYITSAQNFTSNFRPAAGLSQTTATGSVTGIFEVYSMVTSLEDNGEKTKFLETDFSKNITSGTLAAGVFTRVFSLRRISSPSSHFIKILLKSLNIINTGSVPLYWELRAVEAIPSASYSTIDSNSYLEINTTSATTVTASGNIVALAGFVNSGEVSITEISESIANSYPIDEIASSSPNDERGMSLWIKPVSSSTSVTCNIVLNYTEIQL